MTPDQITLVRTTFDKVAPIADIAATMFYDDLFLRDPALRSLFPDDLTEQKKKLMAVIGVAVANLDDFSAIAETVRALGRRHAAYKVRPRDYDTVGASLIAALEKGLGADFTPDAREAWTLCYGLVAGEMMSAAEAPATV